MNGKINKSGLNFIATADEFDKVNPTIVKTAGVKDDKFWTEFMGRVRPVYLITGFYKIDLDDNKIYFENFVLYNNWIEEDKLMKKSISDAWEQLIPLYVGHSLFVPGLGQAKRGQKSIGYTFMGLSGVTLGSAIITESLRQIMLSKAKRNPYSTIYKDNAALFGTLRTGSLIGFGAVYLFNITHALAYKPKKSHLESITFSPNFTNDYYY